MTHKDRPEEDAPAEGRAPSHPEEGPIEAAIDEAIEAEHHGRISMQDLLAAWGDRSYGPLLIFLGFVAATPLSAAPPTAAVLGLVIAGLALQMLFGKRHPWLPAAIRKRSMSAKKLEGARRRFAPFLAAIDHPIKKRLEFATSGPMRRVAAAIVALLGLAMIPFEFVPIAGVAPASAVVLFGVAITARDGLVMLIGVAAFAGVLFLGARLFL
jgi:hypothetical protein